MISKDEPALRQQHQFLQKIARWLFVVVLSALIWVPAMAQGQWKTALIVPGAQTLSSDTVDFKDCYTIPYSGKGNWYACRDQKFRHAFRWEYVQPKVHRNVKFQVAQPGHIYVLVTSRVDASWPYDLGSAAISRQSSGGKWAGIWLGPGLRYAHYRGEHLVDTGPYASQPGIPLLKYRINPDGRIQFWESLPHVEPGRYRLTLTSAMFRNPNTGEQTFHPCTVEYKLLFVPDRPAAVPGTSTQGGQHPQTAGTPVGPATGKEYVWAVNDAHQIFRWNGSGWTHIPGNATDVGVGAHGTVWITGTENSRFGHVIYRWMEDRFARTDGQALRLDVGPWGTPWVANRGGDIYRWVHKHWERLPGGAVDVGVGADGSVFIIGNRKIESGGNGIYHWSGSSWDKYPGAAVRIDVDTSGKPWVVNANGDIFRWTGMAWVQLPGKATDISVGPLGAWVTGTDRVPGGHGIYRWDEAIHNWRRVPGGATEISVGGSPAKVTAPLPTLRTGSYVVDVKVAGTAYHTTWDLQVKGGRIRGISHWNCCPGPRHDALRGTFSGRKVTIQRDCSGQGWKGGCVQTYTGVIKGNRIEGTGTGTGLDGLPVSWVLHLQTGKPTP